MVFYFWEVIKKLSGVGFEPTPTYVDQNAHVPRSTVVNIFSLGLAPLTTRPSWPPAKETNQKGRKFIASHKLI